MPNLCFLLGTKDSLSGSARYIVPIVGASNTEDPTEVPLVLPTTVPPSSHTTIAPPVVLRPPSCTISPPVGDVLSPFKISCSVDPSFCRAGPCVFCFKTASGEKCDLYSTFGLKVKSVYAC